MEYELLELSFVSFSYCCVIFNVIDASVSGHIFSLEIAFNIPSFKLFDYDYFLPLRNIFSIAHQTHPAESFILRMITHLQSLHRWTFMNPVCAVRVRMEKFCQASAEWRCRLLESARWDMRCIDQPALERWANFLGSDWRSGAECRILELSQCKRSAEWEGCVAFGSAGKQTVRWPQRLIVCSPPHPSRGLIDIRGSACVCRALLVLSESEIKPAHNCLLTV